MEKINASSQPQPSGNAHHLADDIRVGILADSSYAEGMRAGYSMGTFGDEARYQKSLARLHAQICEARAELKDQPSGNARLGHGFPEPLDRAEVMHVLSEADRLLPMFTSAEAIGAWREKVRKIGAGEVVDVPPLDEQPSGNAGELLPIAPHLPLNDPAAAYRVLHDYGRQCYKAALAAQASGEDREDADRLEWMADDNRAPWAINSLKDRIKEMRASEKRCRNAFRKDYMRVVSTYFAEAIGEAAQVLEKRLAVIESARAAAGTKKQ